MRWALPLAPCRLDHLNCQAEMTGIVPEWMRYLPLLGAILLGPVDFLLAKGAAWVSLRGYFTRSGSEPNLHWTERARLTLAARRGVALMLVMFPIVALGDATFLVGPLSVAPPWCVAVVAACSSFFGVFAASRGVQGWLGLRVGSLAYALREKAFFFQGAVAVIAVIVGFRALGKAVASGEGWQGLLFLACVPFAFPNLLFFFYRALGALVRDRELEQQLEPLVRGARVVPRKIYVARAHQVNAFAYPLQRTLVVTQGLLDKLGKPEVEAVVAHELGHLVEGWRAALRLSLLGYVALGAFASTCFAGNWSPLGGLVYLCGFFVLALFVQRWSRAREHDADAEAVGAAPPEVHAGALQTIYEANLVPATQRGGTHPSLYDRMERAGVTPAFARPALPPRWAMLPFLPAFLLGLALPALGPLLFMEKAADGWAAAAVFGQRADALAHLALRAWEHEQEEAAAELYAMAEELDPQSPWYPRNLAAVLQLAGQCDAARAASARAYEKALHDPRVHEVLPVLMSCR